MGAVEILRRRVVVASDAFAEAVVWEVEESVPPSRHRYKYRLAYVVAGVCVMRFDNERGKGDRWHWGEVESPYDFTTPKQLLQDFGELIARWNHENGRS